jgi:PKD repeat protein
LQYDESITLKKESTCSYDVDWNNDGTFTDTEIAGEITHDYGTAGTYTIANLLVVTMV